MLTQVLLTFAVCCGAPQWSIPALLLLQQNVSVSCPHLPTASSRLLTSSLSAAGSQLTARLEPVTQRSASSPKVAPLQVQFPSLQPLLRTKVPFPSHS